MKSRGFPGKNTVNKTLINPPLTPLALEKMNELLEQAPPAELREDLLEIYHAYILHEHNALPLHFEKMAIHIHLLIDCLGSLASEIRGNRSKKNAGKLS